jgi:isocitrate dehydrogenase (NAD+)
MTKRKITLIPGDGIGPEVSLAMQRCVDATGVGVEWEIAHAGSDIMEKKGTPLPEEVLELPSKAQSRHLWVPDFAR